MPTVSVIKVNKDGSETGEVEHFEVEENTTIFDSLDSQNCKLAHGCLSGSCGTCRIEILKGKDNLAPMSAVEKDTVNHITGTYVETYGQEFVEGKTLRLSCRAKIKGDVSFKQIKK